MMTSAQPFATSKSFQNVKDSCCMLFSVLSKTARVPLATSTLYLYEVDDEKKPKMTFQS